MIDKRCEEHGDFRDTYWSDVTLYKRFMSDWIDVPASIGHPRPVKVAHSIAAYARTTKQEPCWGTSMLPAGATFPARSALPMQVIVQPSRQ